MNSTKRRHKFWLMMPFLAFFILLVLLSFLKGPNKELAHAERKAWMEKLLKDRIN